MYSWVLLLASAFLAAAVEPSIPKEGWDYIVVGTGPGGLVLADRLSETGARTLVLEAGAPSIYASGGREGPAWVRESGEPLSRFDVPGFFASFNTRPDGHQCPDIPTAAGCLLGGGSAINSGNYFLPTREDWTMNFPAEWHDGFDTAVAKSLTKIIGDPAPGRDDIVWYGEAFDIMGRGMMKKLGWEEVDAAAPAERRHRVYSRTPLMMYDGERGGMLRAYFLPAQARPRVRISYHSRVERVLRNGTTVTGVEYVTKDGERTQVSLGEGGSVVLAAGAFGSPKILWQSGIGTQDQLEIVREARGELMIAEDDWIDLPVGYNLLDHGANYAVFRYPGIGDPYDWAAAYDNPIQEDAELYLRNRSGPLAASSARLSMWEQVEGSDGITRTIQWNGRTGSAGGVPGTDLIQFTNYLGLGLTTRGRLGLTPELNHTIMSTPYFAEEEDFRAVIKSMENVIAGVELVDGLELVLPDLNTTTIDKHVRESTLTRGSNHWMGTAAMGSVVDTDAKVIGLENLYVTDASIFPGMVSGNPQGSFVVMAEQAAAGIIAAHAKYAQSYKDLE